MPTNMDLGGIPSKKTGRRFSFEDVQARLPLIHRIAGDAIKLLHNVQTTEHRIEQVVQRRGDSKVSSFYVEEVDQIQQGILRKKQELACLEKEILALGADKVDFVMGTVRFPATERDGHLLWKVSRPEDLVCVPLQERSPEELV